MSDKNLFPRNPRPKLSWEEFDSFFPKNPRPAEATAILGGSGEPPKDWREKYVTLERFKNVPPPRFLIKNFLEYRAITAIGAPVAQRKSLVVANVIRSLLTGEPLFGEFEVVEQPKHVIYLLSRNGAYRREAPFQTART